MKKLHTLLIFLLILNQSINAQNCQCTLQTSNGSILIEDYDVPSNWTYVGSAPTSMFVAGTVMNYNWPTSSQGANRMVRSVPGLSANSMSFVSEIMINVTGGNSPGHHIMTFTETNQDPIINNPNDGIFVSLIATGGPPPFANCCTIPNNPNRQWQFLLEYKDGFNFMEAVGSIDLTSLGTYYVRLVRNNCRAYLDVCTDPDFTLPIAGSPICIDIPTTVTNFNFVQQGVATWSSNLRTLQMTTDNLRISPYNNGCNLTPQLTIQQDPPNPCPGDTVSLQATGCNGCNYIWSSGANTASTTVNPLVNTTYTVTATSTFGCSSSTSINVDVQNCNFCKEINNPKVGTLTGNDHGTKVVSTPDGGYVVVGGVNIVYTNITNANANNEGDTYFVKYGPAHNIEFQLRLGDFETGTYCSEKGFTVLVRPDGYYVAGFVYKVWATDQDLQITKVNLAGDFQWSKRYGSNNNRNDDVAALLDMSNDGYGNILVVGSLNTINSHSPWDFSLSNYDFMVFAINPNGGIVPNSLKKITYNQANTSSEYARDAVKIAGANGPEYIITGDYSPSVCPSGCLERDVFSVKLDQNLIVVASQLLSLPGKIETVAGIENVGGRIFIAGSIDQNSTNEKIMLAELNPSTLAPVTTYMIDNNLGFDSRALGLTMDTNNKLLIAGRCTNANTIIDDALCMKINVATGLEVEWANYSNTPSIRDIFFSVSDNYIFTGLRAEPLPANQEIFIAKVSPTGASCCLEPLGTSISTLTYPPNSSSWSSPIPNLNTGNMWRDTPSYPEQLICESQQRIIGNDEENIVHQNALKIYPNPNTGTFVLELNNKEEKITAVSITDISGRQISSVKPIDSSSGKFLFNLVTLPNGIYFVQAITNIGKCTSKFSIQK